ncbi:hypothetical protein WAI453_007190 [Rhynchosporium graminicola]
MANRSLTVRTKHSQSDKVPRSVHTTILSPPTSSVIFTAILTKFRATKVSCFQEIFTEERSCILLIDFASLL